MKNLSIIVLFTLFNFTSFSQSNSLDFDGGNDYVNAGNNASVQLSTGTIEAWIKTSNAGSGHRGIVVKQFAFGLFLFDNKLVAYDWSGAGNINTVNFLNDDSWHHVAMSFSSGIANGTKIYIDGVLVTTSTFTINNQTVPLTIGNGGTTIGQKFNGEIDDVRVWNVIRNEMEIQNNRNNELMGNETGLVAYYNFNQGIPNGNNAGVTTLIDGTINGNTGTLIDFALIGNNSNWVGSTAPLTILATVPTLGQWGLIILALLLLNLGTVALRSSKVVIAGGNGNTSFTLNDLPFDGSTFKRILFLVTILLFSIFGIAIGFFNYELTNADIPGSLVAIPLVTYLIFLLREENKEKGFS